MLSPSLIEWVPEEFCIDFHVPNRIVCPRHVFIECNSLYTNP